MADEFKRTFMNRATTSGIGSSKHTSSQHAIVLNTNSSKKQTTCLLFQFQTTPWRKYITQGENFHACQQYHYVLFQSNKLLREQGYNDLKSPTAPPHLPLVFLVFCLSSSRPGQNFGTLWPEVRQFISRVRHADASRQSQLSKWLVPFYEKHWWIMLIYNVWSLELNLELKLISCRPET